MGQVGVALAVDELIQGLLEVDKVVLWLSKAQHIDFVCLQWCLGTLHLCMGPDNLGQSLAGLSPVDRSQGYVHLVQKLLWASSCATAVLHLCLSSPVPLQRVCRVHRQCGAGLRIRSSRAERCGDGTWAMPAYKVLG